MKTHDIARGLMQHQVDVIKWNNRRKPIGQIVEQLVQVAMRRNGFGHLQEQAQSVAFSSIRITGGNRLSVWQRYRHCEGSEEGAESPVDPLYMCNPVGKNRFGLLTGA